MATALENTNPAWVDANGMPQPPTALVVNTCKHLIEHTPLQPAANGSYAYGVAIFRDAHPGAYHRYIVWTLILRPESCGQEWVVEEGDYCFTLTEALEAYKRRGGKV